MLNIAVRKAYYCIFWNYADFFKEEIYSMHILTTLTSSLQWAPTATLPPPLQWGQSPCSQSKQGCLGP